MQINTYKRGRRIETRKGLKCYFIHIVLDIVSHPSFSTVENCFRNCFRRLAQKIMFPDLFIDLLHLFTSVHSEWTLTNTLGLVPDSELNQGARFSEI